MGCVVTIDQEDPNRAIFRQRQSITDSDLNYFKPTSSLKGETSLDYAKAVRIGPFLQENGDVTSNLSEWRKELKFIDEKYLDDKLVLESFFQKKKNSKESDDGNPDRDEKRWAQVYRHKEAYPFVQTYVDVQIICYSLTQWKQFKQQVYVGPPQGLRWACWKQLLFRRQLKYGSLDYEKFLESNCEGKKIEQDINRTLVSHHFLQMVEHAGLGQQQLARVLQALSNYNPQVSYCQGMNAVAGYLLITSRADETNAFRAFTSLLQGPTHLMQGCYSDGLPMLEFLCYVVRMQLATFIPSVSAELRKRDQDAMWLHKYVLTLFLQTIDLQKCVRLWDYVMLRGAVRALPEIILAMVWQVRESLLTDDVMLLYEALNRDLESRIDIEETIRLARFTYRIRSKGIRMLARQYVNQNKCSESFSQIILNFNSKK